MLTSWTGTDVCPVDESPCLEPADVALEDGREGPGGPQDGNVDVSPIPVPLPNPADDGSDVMLDYTGPGGMTPEIEFDNLEPAPDYDAMTPGERAVVDIIARAIADQEFRAALLWDASEAIAGYTVTEEDRALLSVMPEESFDFFACEVEARFGEAMADDPEGALFEAQQEVTEQVVHAVWRDLNPGGLAYVLAYKIPNKHLK